MFRCITPHFLSSSDEIIFTDIFSTINNITKHHGTDCVCEDTLMPLHLRALTFLALGEHHTRGDKGLLMVAIIRTVSL